MAIGKQIIQGAKEARAYARGEADVSEYGVHKPVPKTKASEGRPDIESSGPAAR